MKSKQKMDNEQKVEKSLISNKELMWLEVFISVVIIGFSIWAYTIPVTDEDHSSIHAGLFGICLMIILVGLFTVVIGRLKKEEIRAIDQDNSLKERSQGKIAFQLSVINMTLAIISAIFVLDMSYSSFYLSRLILTGVVGVIAVVIWRIWKMKRG